jgi:uncharacterized membrane protein
MSEEERLENEIASLFEEVRELDAAINIKFSKIDSLKYDLAQLLSKLQDNEDR